MNVKGEGFYFKHKNADFVRNHAVLNLFGSSYLNVGQIHSMNTKYMNIIRKHVNNLKNYNNGCKSSSSLVNVKRK